MTDTRSLTPEAPPQPTETLPASPSNASTKLPLQLLSHLLKNVPSNETRLILEHFEGAVNKGMIKAVPAAGQPPFAVEFLTAQGRPKSRSMTDELVLADDAFFSWFALQRKASWLAALHVTGQIETTEERVERGEDDFFKLVEIRRKRNQKHTQKNKPKKPGK